MIFVFWSLKMAKKLYVGNLGSEMTESNLTQMFAPHGTVESVRIVIDKDTGRSKGFGFVQMMTDQEAQNATAALNGQDSGGRQLTIREAKLSSKRGRNGMNGEQPNRTPDQS
jgi:RNA recognition motif-containing protein